MTDFAQWIYNLVNHETRHLKETWVDPHFQQQLSEYCRSHSEVFKQPSDSSFIVDTICDLKLRTFELIDKNGYVIPYGTKPNSHHTEPNWDSILEMFRRHGLYSLRDLEALRGRQFRTTVKKPK